MNEYNYFCPLLKTTINEGLCLDINFEYSGFVKSNELLKRNIKKEDACKKCETCEHYPL